MDFLLLAEVKDAGETVWWAPEEFNADGHLAGCLWALTQPGAAGHQPLTRVCDIRPGSQCELGLQTK